ncbi:MAG: hypothetical protein JXR11_08930 [Balneola sp.]
MEQNNVRKYLLYAAGEIFLVVIGILIALQVNNWNEQNKNKKRAGILLEAIKADLESDIAMIDSVETLVDQQIAEFDKLQDKLTSPEVNAEKIIELIKNEFNPLLGGIPGFNDNSYRSATSSGTISDLNADHREQLYELYIMQSLAMRILQDYEQLYLKNINEFIAHYPLKLSFVAFNKGLVYEQKWASPDFDQFTTLFNATGTSWRNFYRILKLLLIEAREKTMDTLTVLNNKV